MKAAFFLVGLFSLTNLAFAEQVNLDDLETIELNLNEKETITYSVHYPNYRLGGGTPARMKISDCLLLDVKNSDRVIHKDVKLKLAKALIVEDGFRYNEESSPVLKPTVKGDNIVFRLVTGSAYMTHILVKTKNGESLQSNLDALLPEATPVGLVYVRACRF